MIQKRPLSIFALSLVALAAYSFRPDFVSAQMIEEPHYGGVVQRAADLLFELVTHDDGATIYVSDFDDEYDATNISGRLTSLNGSVKSEVALRPVGGNKLEARGITIEKGASVFATLDNNGRDTVTIWFRMK